jgi:DeoR/GlpR family transcriptional regulator of sugar metabolism
MFESAQQPAAPLRRSQILLELRDAPIVSVSDLARRFGVSEMTIRRDLRTLEAEGQVRKVHGGAVRAQDAPAAVRSTRNLEAKRGIAAAAASRVPDQATIVLDAGTTVCALARLLANRPITIITHSLLAISELGSDPEAAAYLVGGRFRALTQSMAGGPTVAAIDEFRAEIAFLGASAVDADGFYNHHVDDVAIQRKIIEVADEAWLLADSSKFSSTALAKVASLSALAGIITDSPLEPSFETELRSRFPDLELVVVSDSQVDNAAAAAQAEPDGQSS